MHLYRCSDMYDDYQVYVCLTCKESFEATAPGKFCCNCGVKFDGEFTKRNRRWNITKHTDWRNPGYKDDENGLMCQSDEPRVIVEVGTWITQKISKSWFSIEPMLIPELRWNLVTHTTAGNLARRHVNNLETQCCGFVSCYETFKRYRDAGVDVIRIRLLNGCKSRVLKEHRRNMDFKAFIASQKESQRIAVSGSTATGCW